MRRLIMLFIVVGMLIGTGGCDDWTGKPVYKPAPEPISVNDTPDWIAPDEKGWIWKIGYVPAKAIHEFISGVSHGLCGKEPVKGK